ncbi:MAG: hypothetical protein PVG97_06020 [Syntrophobacterales bacterium]|jgi:hypothetical protein
MQGSIVNPYESLALLISGHPFKDELSPHEFQERIVKVELLFKRQISDSALVLE